MLAICWPEDIPGGITIPPIRNPYIPLITHSRLYFYVEFAFAGVLLIFAFLFVEETTYTRKTTPTPQNQPSSENAGKETQTERIEALEIIPPRRPFLQTLKPWGHYDKDAEYFMTIARSFTYFLVPSVLWVITSFGQSILHPH